MKKVCYIVFIIATNALAQNALYNSGNLRLHGNGQLGFHTDLINDGTFDQNEGLAGFYGDETLLVSGSIPTEFTDIEIVLGQNLLLRTPIGVTNNVNFIVGDVITSRNEQIVYLDFKQDAFFTGENDDAKVDGFAAITNKAFFSFPVGDNDQLRPLLLESNSENDLAICAYFFENPGNPSSLDESFDTEESVRDIGSVSATEFWVLKGNVPSQVTVSWNARSNLANIANDANEIILVGWNIAVNRWTVIGNSAISGDLTQGFLISETFVPNDYAALTFGTVPLPLDTFAVNNPTLGDYFLSPNGDGINDSLIIEGMEESPNNSLRIFNRFGQIVFEQINYVDEFVGVSNRNNFVISRDIGLPEGVYFYVATLDDLELEYQGFLFLDR